MSDEDKKHFSCPKSLPLSLCELKCLVQDLDDTMIIDLESGETNIDAIFVMKRMRKRNTVLMCLI